MPTVMLLRNCNINIAVVLTVNVPWVSIGKTASAAVLIVVVLILILFLKIRAVKEFLGEQVSWDLISAEVDRIESLFQVHLGCDCTYINICPTSNTPF